MKILVAIPIIINPEVARECINQVVSHSDVDVLLCNNGGGPIIQNLLNEYKDVPGVILQQEPVNLYVNKIWNRFIEYFVLNSDKYTHLIILNSDLTLNKNWVEVVKTRWEMRPAERLLPAVTDDKTKMYTNVSSTEYDPTAQRVYEGIPGIFITLTQGDIKNIYPIPRECKVWYGDNWVFTSLVATGKKMIIVPNLLAYHHHSTSVSTVPGIHDIIEQDKLMWKDVVQPKLIEHIKNINKF